MSSLQQVVCELFGLSSDEFIYDDFSCAVFKTILVYGRLFCTEKHICFFSDVFGIKNKIVIDINDITALNKKASLGFLQNALEIVCKNNKTYYFTGFSNRNAVYNIICAAWQGTPAIDDNESVHNPENDLSNQETKDSGDSTITFLPTEKIDNVTESMKLILPLTVDKFFDLFISDNAAYSLSEHFQVRGESDIKLTNWTKSEEMGLETRELTAVIKLVGVPFKDKSRLHKIQTYKKENGVLIIQSMSKTLDVPYGGSFQVEEKWEVSPCEGNPEKCLLRCTTWVRFWKSFPFKGTAETRAIEGIIADTNLWLKTVREKKLIQEGPEKKSTGNVEVAHGVEKSEEMAVGQLKDNKIGKVSRSVLRSKAGTVTTGAVENIIGNVRVASLSPDFEKKLAILNFALSLILFMLLIAVTFYFLRRTNYLEVKIIELEIQNKNQLEIIETWSEIIKKNHNE